MGDEPQQMQSSTRRMVRHDWDALEREFILNTEYPSVATWFQQIKGWSANSVRTGNFLEKTFGWATKRASLQQHITNDAIESLKQVEKERFPQLLATKFNVVAQIISEVDDWDNLTTKDKKLIYEIIKSELGEPTKASGDFKIDETKRIPILGVIK